VLDIFSRYVVGWRLALREAGGLAKRLFAETCAKQEVPPGQMTIHADRGSSMRSQGVAMLLGSPATRSHSVRRRLRSAEPSPYGSKLTE
jgi:putative transposase